MRPNSSVRWAFNFRAWEPTEQEWILATQCIQVEEKQRIGKFTFKDNAKASMVGRLMIRKFAHLATGMPYDDIIIGRDDNNRPYLKNPSKPLDFNVSHQGHYTVFAGEIDSALKVGVDVMHLERKTGHHLSEFFRLMKRQMSEEEWHTILKNSSDLKRSETFFRLWSLKESYVKAMGIGLSLNLQHLSFTLNDLSLSCDKICDSTSVELDRVIQRGWKFHECLLDSEHCVSVALYNSSDAELIKEPVPFSILSWSEVISDLKPIIPPDILYCQEFFNKDDYPI